MTMSIFPALMSGCAIGFTLGLIGGGGSILATPLLLYVVGISQPHVAIGTGALAVSTSAFLTLFSHASAGNVRWSCALTFAVVGVVGASIGSALGKLVDGRHLLFLFSLVMAVVGVLMLRPRGSCDLPANARPVTCGRWSAAQGRLAIVVGGLSGFFGIGGGFLVVPGLVYATGMPVIHAVGTSLFAVGLFGVATIANYAVSGLIDWPVAGEFVLGGLLGVWLGTMSSCHLAAYKSVLGQIFAAVVFATAAFLAWRNFPF